MQFSIEELSLFARRFENGYDLQHDERYNLWLGQKDGGSLITTEYRDSDSSECVVFDLEVLFRFYLYSWCGVTSPNFQDCNQRLGFQDGTQRLSFQGSSQPSSQEDVSQRYSFEDSSQRP